jgi:hypothetical protein
MGFLLYVVAGILAMSEMNNGVIVLLAATIFLAFGFFINVKLKWFKLFKKRTK